MIKKKSVDIDIAQKEKEDFNINKSSFSLQRSLDNFNLSFTQSR